MLLRRVGGARADRFFRRLLAALQRHHLAHQAGEVLAPGFQRAFDNGASSFSRRTAALSSSICYSAVSLAAESAFSRPATRSLSAATVSSARASAASLAL